MQSQKSKVATPASKITLLTIQETSPLSSLGIPFEIVIVAAAGMPQPVSGGNFKNDDNGYRSNRFVWKIAYFTNRF